MEAIKLCRLDTPIIFIEARINLSRFVVTGCAAKTSATVTFPSLNLISLFAFCFRSEERRVGKAETVASFHRHAGERVRSRLRDEAAVDHRLQIVALVHTVDGFDGVA